MKDLNYKKLEFYGLMRELVVLVYAVTKRIPEDEQGFTGIVSQLRRAIVSAVSNVAEGSSRREKELLHFLSLSLGSLREVEAQIGICRDLEYIDEASFKEINDKLNICIGKLCVYMKKIYSKLDS